MINATDSTLTISWSFSETNIVFSEYELKINNVVHNSTSVPLNNNAVREVTINGLTPNRMHEISLTAISGGQSEERSAPATASSYTGENRMVAQMGHKSMKMFVRGR